jgi:hypothetical protein
VFAGLEKHNNELEKPQNAFRQMHTPRLEFTNVITTKIRANGKTKQKLFKMYFTNNIT